MEHLLKNKTEFIEFFYEEYNDLQGSWDNRNGFWENIRPDNTLGRINMKKLKYLLDNKEKEEKYLNIIIDYFIDTAIERHWGNATILIDCWNMFIKNVKDGIWGEMFLLNDVLKYDEWLRKNDFPAVHHSEVFDKEYDPHYRLIDSKYLSEFFFPTDD